MTLIVGNVVDVGLGGLDGELRVWAGFRPEVSVLIAPFRRTWDITGGVIPAGVELAPGPAMIEVDMGLDAIQSFEVMIPDVEQVTIQDLFLQKYTWTPHILSETLRERQAAEAAADGAERSADTAVAAEIGALSAEARAALHAATMSARVDQGGQEILYTSDGKPYLVKPGSIKNVPLTINKTVGTRVMLGDVMIYGDTGWRNVSELFGEPPTAGKYLIRRTTDSVQVRVESFRYATVGTRVADLGFGFSVASNGYPLVTMTGASSSLGWNGQTTFNQITAGSAPVFSFTMPVGQLANWPTSLPGTPA